MSQFDILKIRIDNLSKEEVLQKIKKFSNEPTLHQIATINPEFILEAQKNPEFKNILNDCDLNVADGFGIKLAFWRYGKNLKARIAGADLMLEILKLANQKKHPIFLAINSDGLSSFKEIKNAILRIYPELEIVDYLDSKSAVDPEKPKSSILFCNFGAPQQELFINSLKSDNIRIAMGVGGSFDYLTNKIKRAPKFIQYFGLEWLWRLILQPKRIKRIFRAVIVFPIYLFKN